MSAYIHFDGFVGGVTVGTHAGWSRLEAVDFAASLPAGPQAARRHYGPHHFRIRLADLPDGVTPELMLACSRGHHSPPRVVVKLDFTRADGRGGETTELSLALHDVVVERDYTIPWSSGGTAADKRFRLWFSRITHAMMPPSSPDVSHLARLALMKMGDAAASPEKMGYDLTMARRV